MEKSLYTVMINIKMHNRKFIEFLLSLYHGSIAVPFFIKGNYLTSGKPAYTMSVCSPKISVNNPQAFNGRYDKVKPRAFPQGKRPKAIGEKLGDKTVTVKERRSGTQ